MAEARERFVEAATALGISIEAVRYPAGTRTAQDAADAIGCTVAQIVKSLVVVVETDGHEAPAIALTSGSRQLDPAALAELLGAGHVRMASAEEARAATGFAIGGTPPFGHPHVLPTYLDPHLREHDEVWAAAGTPTDVFRLGPDDLLRAGARDVGDFTA